MDASVAGETLEFEGWRFDTRVGELRRQGPDGSWAPIPIGTRARDILAILLQRPGTLVSKDAIIDAVWPNVTVEPNNLTVQIATLRRTLDNGRTGDSSIETVAGRGYRFIPRVTRLAEPATEPPQPTASPVPPTASGRTPHHRLKLWLLAGSCAVAIAVWLGLTGWQERWFGGEAVPPRLSLVVLPFQNLGGSSADAYLADGITDDLITELSHIPNALVIARESAYSFQGQAVDVRTIGRQLGVRYAIEGGVRRLGQTLQVNARLVSTETGENLWSDRFDEAISEMSAGQEQLVMRMRDQLGISIVQIEAARSLLERPVSPDAFDLILRARSIRILPPNSRRNQEALALFERALTLDPNSVDAMTGVAYYLTDAVGNEGWGDSEKLLRAGSLLARARAMAPDSEAVLNTYVYWLRSVGRCPEVIELTERALRTDPTRMRAMTGIYNELAICKVLSGHSDEALALQQEADRLNPLSPWKASRYAAMGDSSLWLGRDHDAIRYYGQSLALNPETGAGIHWMYRKLGAAYALSGQIDEARHYLSKADRLWPYDSVRSHYPDDPSNRVFAAQIRRFQDGLRLAGLRDHADEDADFGVTTDSVLHSNIAGYTPKDAPGAKIIHTADLPGFLGSSQPIVIDTMSYTWGVSIPGAVGLKFVGLGGSFDDASQGRLDSKMRDLASGDLSRPIVAVGWNSERFDGRNLALRLVALGYTNVYWYRGGREAWEVAGLPETELAVQDW